MDAGTVIFTHRDRDDYLRLLSAHGLDLDVYYSPDYLREEAALQNGEYEIFTHKNHGGLFVYPYLTLPVGLPSFEAHVDLCSPYGYPGPFATGDDIFAEGENALLSYLAGRKAVTEFVRYHWSYNNGRLFTRNIDNVHNRTVVVLDLRQEWETIWKEQFSSTNRNLIRKLGKSGYVFEAGGDAAAQAEFVDMYYRTMDNVEARDFYYFDKEYFLRLFQVLGDKIRLFRVTRDSVTYATSLFFVSGGIVTYYLSARNFDFPEVPATNFLLGNTVKWAVENKLEFFNFGGGNKHTPDDPLFKFKRVFAKETRPFYIGKRIHDRAAYDKITAAWIGQHGRDAYETVKHTLQFYRD